MGKAIFPASWEAQKILDLVSKVTDDPASRRHVHTSGRIQVVNSREGVDITVILEPIERGGRVITAFPLQAAVAQCAGFTYVEALLSKFMNCERSRLPAEACSEAVMFIDHDECGCAYDVFVFLVRANKMVLSSEGEMLLRQAAAAMEIEYPNLSTD